jgi:hypothetical protein
MIDHMLHQRRLKAFKLKLSATASGIESDDSNRAMPPNCDRDRVATQTRFVKELRLLAARRSS